MGNMQIYSKCRQNTINKPVSRIINLLFEIISNNKNSNIGKINRKTWDSLYKISMDLSMTGELYYRLKTYGLLDLLPTEVVKKLKNTYMVITAKNMIMQYELKKTLNLLKEENIPVIVLKGAFTAENIYESLGQRPMNDIDILIERENLKRADRLLCKEGYKTEQNKTWIEKYHYHYGYISKERKFPLELHWLLLKKDAGFLQEMELIWKRSIPFETEDFKARSLSPEDQIIYLSLHHAYLHGFTINFIQIYDIYKLLKFYDINFDNLLELSKTYRAEKALILTLNVLENIFPASLPKAFLDKKADEEIIKLSIDLLLKLKDVPNTAFSRFMGNKKIYVLLFSLYKSLFPSKEVLSGIYQLKKESPLFFIYYLKRIFDLIKKYVPTILLYLTGNKKVRKDFENEKKRNYLRNWLTSFSSSRKKQTFNSINNM